MKSFNRSVSSSFESSPSFKTSDRGAINPINYTPHNSYNHVKWFDDFIPTEHRHLEIRHAQHVDPVHHSIHREPERSATRFWPNRFRPKEYDVGFRDIPPHIPDDVVFRKRAGGDEFATVENEMYAKFDAMTAKDIFNKMDAASVAANPDKMMKIAKQQAKGSGAKKFGDERRYAVLDERKALDVLATYDLDLVKKDPKGYMEKARELAKGASKKVESAIKIVKYVDSKSKPRVPVLPAVPQTTAADAGVAATTKPPSKPATRTPTPTRTRSNSSAPTFQEVHSETTEGNTSGSNPQKKSADADDDDADNTDISSEAYINEIKNYAIEDLLNVKELNKSICKELTQRARHKDKGAEALHGNTKSTEVGAAYARKWGFLESTSGFGLSGGSK